LDAALQLETTHATSFLSSLSAENAAQFAGGFAHTGGKGGFNPGFDLTRSVLRYITERIKGEAQFICTSYFQR
jgi:hypothetical protein